MPKKYRLTPQADSDLESIFIYTHTRWGMLQAEKYLGELDAYMQKLADGKLKGKSCKNLIQKSSLQEGQNVDSLYYYHANKHYIIYQTVRSGVDILTLYHDKMNLEQRLMELPETL